MSVREHLKLAKGKATYRSPRYEESHKFLSHILLNLVENLFNIYPNSAKVLNKNYLLVSL
jgi:hypothetical protein